MKKIATIRSWITRLPPEGPLIAPGKTSLIDHVRWGYGKIPSGTALILFGNLPGHSGKGEFAVLTIE